MVIFILRKGASIGKLNKVTIAVDEPMLTEADKKMLMDAERRSSD